MVRELGGQISVRPFMRLDFQPGKGASHDQDPLRSPRPLRELTEKSLEEARKAFESFIEAAHKATAQAEGTANALQSSAKEASVKALSFTEAHVKAARSRPEAH